MNELCCNRAEFEIMLPVEMNDNYVHNVADNDVGWLRFCCFVAASVNFTTCCWHLGRLNKRKRPIGQNNCNNKNTSLFYYLFS